MNSVQRFQPQTREITFAEQRRERVRDFFELDLSDAEADASFAGYSARYEAGWQAYDDAAPSLRRARAKGLTTMVLTNGDEGQQLLKLHRVGLRDEVDGLIASSMLPFGKPDPSAFRSALDLVGLEPFEALMVGDSLEKDVMGALSAGMQAVLLDRHGSASRDGVISVRSLRDLEFA